MNKMKIIEQVWVKTTMDYILSDNPTPEELLLYVRLNIKRKRLRKKFLKHPMYYTKRLPKCIVKEFTSKLLSNSFGRVVWNTMNRESFARKVLLVKPLSEEEILKFNENLYIG